MKQRSGVWTLLVLIILSLAACQSTDQGAELQQTYEPDTETATVAFQVADKVVTTSDVEQRVTNDLGPAIEQLLQQGRTRDEITDLATEQNILQVVFDQLIQEELLLHLAQEEGVGVDPEEIDAEIERQQAFSNDPTSDQDMTKMRAEATRNQLILKMMALHTTTDRFKSRHILLRVSLPMTATEEEQQEAFDERRVEAEELLKELADGADFAELAKEKSEDPGSAEQGGDLGWTPRGVFVPEYETVALSPTVELNDPVLVESQFGYHIIEVQERKFDEPFENVDDLRSIPNAGQLIDSSFMPWYEDYRKEAEEAGTLIVNESYDPTSIELPFPEDVPEAPADEDAPATEPDAPEAEPTQTE